MHKSLSIYLDLIPFLAAMAVFNVHANFGRFTDGIPGLWQLAGLGNDAVMVFFVLSGFLIAHVCDQKERTPRAYFVSRFAWLYSVVATILGIWALGTITERRKGDLRRGLLRIHDAIARCPAHSGVRPHRHVIALLATSAIIIR